MAEGTSGGKESSRNYHIMKLTVTVEKEELSDGSPVYVALCPELDIASQGETQQEARMNLNEAVHLFLEDADDAELGRRFRTALTAPELLLA